MRRIALLLLICLSTSQLSGCGFLSPKAATTTSETPPAVVQPRPGRTETPQKPTDQPPANAKPIPIKIFDIYEVVVEFAANELAATRKYRGKYVELMVDTLGPVRLSSGGRTEINVRLQGDAASIRCIFEPRWSDLMESLKAGPASTDHHIIRGIFDRDDSAFILRDCAFFPDSSGPKNAVPLNANDLLAQLKEDPFTFEQKNRNKWIKIKITEVTKHYEPYPTLDVVTTDGISVHCQFSVNAQAGLPSVGKANSHITICGQLKKLYPGGGVELFNCSSP
jgi:hypothetical protein